MAGGMTDGQLSIRAAVAQAFPEGPHQLCHFHSLHEAAKPISEADRHAKQVLKKHGRGGRPLARAVEGRTGPEAELPLHERLTTIAQSLERVEKRGPCPRPSGA
jgi:hypothetical protein